MRAARAISFGALQQNASTFGSPVREYDACRAILSGYTNGMKTAVSLPDLVFLAAERQAKRVRKSRSQLYAEALAEYLSRHAPEEVTEAMNQVVDQMENGRDPFVHAAAHSVLHRIEW